MANQTESLLRELEDIDNREDDILDVLLRHGKALEESERRLNMVSLADLKPLREGLTALEATIDKLQEDVQRADAASTPLIPAATGTSNGHDTAAPVATDGTDAPAPVAATPTDPSATPADPADPSATPTPVPLSSMTFEELRARIVEQDTQAAQIKQILRERLLTLGGIAVDPQTGMPTPVVPQDEVIVAEPRTFKLAKKPMTGPDVEAFQRLLNFRFEKWAINIRVSEDGVYGKGTRHNARRVLLGLGIDLEDAKGGITPQLRRLIEKPSLRTPEQLRRAKKNRSWLHRLKAKVAKPKPGQTPKPDPTPGKPAPGSLQARIRKHGGHYEDIIVREAKRHGLEVSLVCAVMEHESAFRNIYGRDPVPNPIKSPGKGGVREVNEENYKIYLKHRNNKQGCQGVGPMQLTFGPLQDMADDKWGGCWKPSANVRIGCWHLRDRINALGSKRQGLRAYNGTGDRAEEYARAVLKKQAVWHERLKGAKAAPLTSSDKPHRPPRPEVPRTFKVTKPHTKSKAVRGFQRDLNARFKRWKINIHVSEDGEYGPATRHAARQVMLGLGIAISDSKGGITPALRTKIRNPSRRTPEERARAKRHRSYLERLRKRVNSRGALRLRAYHEAKRMHDLDIRESGFNRGKMVDQIIRANQGALGEAWCGDFMAWCYRKAGSKAVNRSWAGVAAVGGLAGVKRTKNPRKGDLVRFGFPPKDHIGMFVSWCNANGSPVAMGQASHVKSLDGNTGGSGGDGVHIKVRPRSAVRDFLHITR